MEKRDCRRKNKEDVRIFTIHFKINFSHTKSCHFLNSRCSINIYIIYLICSVKEIVCVVKTVSSKNMYIAYNYKSINLFKIYPLLHLYWKNSYILKNKKYFVFELIQPVSDCAEFCYA